MEHDAKSLLFEIVESCRKIDEFTAGIHFDMYSGDTLIKSAVERQFIIIGEALNRLKQTDEEIFAAIANAPQIIGFRNILVHGYDVVSDQLVWGIVSENLAELKAQCEKGLS
jgi:uncharacterized protein with HEPN domain